MKFRGINLNLNVLTIITNCGLRIVHGHDIWRWNHQLFLSHQCEPIDLLLYIESFVLKSSMVAECSCTANFIMFIIVFSIAKLSERSLKQRTSRSTRGREPIWQTITRSLQVKWRRWDLYHSQKHMCQCSWYSLACVSFITKSIHQILSEIPPSPLAPSPQIRLHS